MMIRLYCVLLSLLIVGSARGAIIAHYALDGDGLDQSGNGNHGTVFGATATADRFGNASGAIAFDGLDDYVGASQLLFDGDHMTVAFWAKSSGQQNPLTVMVSQGHWGADNPFDSGFAFQYGHPASTQTEFIWGDNLGGAHTWNTQFFPIDLETNLSWHHYAATSDGSSTKIYFDGALVSQMAGTLAFGTYDLNIGRDFFLTDNNHRAFNGAIDDLYVQNSSLSQTGIQALMNPPAVPEPASLTLWGFGALGCAVAGYRRKKQAV